MRINFILLILFTFSFSQCKENKTITDYNFNSENIKVIKLPSKLNEISGLSFSNENNLFCHNDESGIIYQIDPITAKIIKRFQLGTWGIEADFEDIAIAEDKFFLITSSGMLYEFDEGSDQEKVKFKEIDLGFSSNFEIEGLCYDPQTKSLLITSKNYSGKKNKNKRAVFSFSLQTYKISKTPRFLISLKELEDKYGIKEFFPSAISREPGTGNFFILSSKGKPAIVEIDSSGTLISGKKLKKKNHPQPEGLAFNKNRDMLISDEAVDKSARITIYKYNKE